MSTLPNPGDVLLDRFEIERPAGIGGMGVVYRARDRSSGAPVALKVMHAEQFGDPDKTRRFVAEAELLAQLRHPNIVEFVARGITPGKLPFLAMEWLEGEDVGQRLERGALSVDDALALMGRLAGALRVTHGHSVIHRDLKPGNLFLPAGDLNRVKLLDFGVAQRMGAALAADEEGMLIGTPQYMAPEQARGESDLTLAVDVFAMGCILYECLAGEPPFLGEHISAVLVSILYDEPIPIRGRRSDVPVTVDALLARMMAKEADWRLADAEALASAVSDFAETPAGDEPDAADDETAEHSRTMRVPSFATNEQALFTLVLANPRAHGDENSPSRDPEFRLSVLAALRLLEVNAEFLINGSLVSAVPQSESVTDQAELAARVALRIRALWPDADIGVATGRGVADGAGAAGEVVDRANGLFRQAGDTDGDDTDDAAADESANHVRVDDLTRRFLGPRFTVRDARTGGLLIGEDRDVDATRPLLGKPTSCVGRDEELAAMDAMLTASSRDGATRSMLITAAAGVGKSRLRHEFLRRVDQREDNIAVLLGRGDLLNAGAGYAIIGQALRRVSGIDSSQPADEQRRRFVDRIGRHVADGERRAVTVFLGEICGIVGSDDDASLLGPAREDPLVMSERIRSAFLTWLAAECAASPVLLVLDDLQWGDGLTVALLRHCLREMPDMRLFAVCLARPEVYDNFPELGDDEHIAEMPLRGLGEAACARLIEQVVDRDMPAGVIARAVEMANGNALFLEELIRALAEGDSIEGQGAPESVIAMLQSRIGRFARETRRAVRAAAVFGQTFWRAGVAAILELMPADASIDRCLDELLAAEIIERQPSARLTGQTEYAFRHALVCDAAYGLLTDDDLQTGHRAAGEFLEACNERDAAVIARHFEQGGELERAAPMYLRAGDDSARLGLYTAARAHYTRALDALASLPATVQRRRQQVDAMLRLTRVALVSDHTEQNLQRLAEADALISVNLDAAPAGEQPEQADRHLLARIRYLMGRVHYYAAQYREAIGHYQQVLGMAQGLDDPELIALPGAVIGMATCAQGHMNKGQHFLTMAVGPLEAVGNDFELVRSQLYRGFAFACLGDYQRAMAHLDTWQERAQQNENPLLIVMGQLLRLMSHRSAMNWPALVADAEGVGDSILRQGEKVYAILGWNLEAWGLVHTGQRERAAAVRERALALTADLGGNVITADWYRAGDAEHALVNGDLDLALDRARAVIEASSAVNLVQSWGVAQRVRAVVAGRQGEPLDAVEAHMRECLRVFEIGGLVLDSAQAELWWGQVLQERGHGDAARPHLDQALEIFAKAGAEHAASLVRDAQQVTVR